MVQINFALREVNCKIVYYGCGLSGKTTNLEVVHGKAPRNHVGELTSIATEGDRTLFFDFLPLNLGHVAGMNTKFQIYTVPGQVYYNSTRKLVLQGADGIVFVADSRKGKMDENIESLQNLEENLRAYGMDIHTIPLVMQYNKRDLPDIYTIEELEEKLNRFSAPHFEAVAVTGEGVFPTLKKLSSMVLESLNRQQGSTVVRAPRKQAMPAKQPAMVGAAGPQRPVAATRGKSPAAPQRDSSEAAGRTKAGAARSRNAVVKDRVVRSPEVKPIERRSPPQKGVTVRRPVVSKPAASSDCPQAQPRKSKAGLITVLLLLLLAGAGAAAYFFLLK
ncbi:MAG: GTPase [Planctomycetes bacterium]|nr:GTPase [Planctomycetota bacterium]